MTEDEAEHGLTHETVVVNTEQGMVITGNRLEIFEARLMSSMRKPFFLLFGLVGLIFVFLFGLSIFLSSLKNTVTNTDHILVQATGPASQAKQKEVIKSIADDLNCNDQRNLQRAFDKLSVALPQLGHIDIIEPPCDQ